MSLAVGSQFIFEWLGSEYRAEFGQALDLEL